MNTPLPDPAAAAPHTAQRWLRWWHVLLFFLPSIVCVGTTWVLAEMTRAKDSPSGYPYLFGPGFTGVVAGAACCVVSAGLLGLTTKARYPVLSCLGWAVLCVMVNVGLSIAGCGVLEKRFTPYP